jgi:hypothetical protein
MISAQFSMSGSPGGGGAAEPVGRDLAELDDQELFGRRAFPSTWGPVEPLGRDLVPA